jgi:hypothetical protein
MAEGPRCRTCVLEQLAKVILSLRANTGPHLSVTKVQAADERSINTPSWRPRFDERELGRVIEQIRTTPFVPSRTFYFEQILGIDSLSIEGGEGYIRHDEIVVLEELMERENSHIEATKAGLSSKQSTRAST